MENIQENHPESSQTRNRKKGLFIFIVLLMLIAALSVTWYFLFEAGKESTEDAYVQGNLVQITPQIKGSVTEIFADDGDYIQQGEALIDFDSSDAEISFQTAKANLAQTVRKVRSLFNNVEQAKAVVAQRKIELNKARTDYLRRQEMVKAGGLSQEELSHARDETDSAEKALAVSVQQLRSQEAMTYNTDVASHPLVQTAVANLRQSYLYLKRTKLVAPVSGYIAKRNAQVGQRVSAGTTMMSVVPLDQVWVDANFKETQMREMRIGQPVTLISDLYGDDVIFHGNIESLGIGTGSAFSLLPAQNATGNWIKVVQRLPVRIKVDAAELAAHPLRIGLSMHATVDTENQQGKLLSAVSHQQPHYQTDVYGKQMAGIARLTDQIIQNNDIAGQ